MRKTQFGIKCVVTLLFAMSMSSVSLGQLSENYIWNWTQQNVWSRSIVTLGAQQQQGITLADPPNPLQPPDPDGFVATYVLLPLNRPAPGGGGGGGGAGAPGGGGAAGANASGLDGLDGANGAGGTVGGKGGKAGGQGYADVSALAEGINQTNPGLQPIMNWTFIHNQIGHVDLKGGGGGGGGGGSLGFIAFGGGGGAGGGGDTATGNLVCRQESDARIVAAQLILNPAWNLPPLQNPPPTPPPPLTRVGARVQIGWISGGTSQGGGDTMTWTRGVNMLITFGGATLAITGGPTGNVTAWGITPNGVFVKQGLGGLESDSGVFGMGEAEFNDLMTVGTIAAISNGGTGVCAWSQLSGNPFPQAGGNGGNGGSPLGGVGMAGANAGNAAGAVGGAGGLGGAGAGGGFNGGKGGAGGKGAGYIADESGIFQGMIEIIADI